LLADTRDGFAAIGKDRLPTTALVSYLNKLEESTWAEFQQGRPLSSQALARQLKPFGIRPKDIRFEQAVQKGYLRADFEDEWERYLSFPSSESAQEGQQGRQTAIDAGSEAFGEGQQARIVADSKSTETTVNTRSVAGVALQAGTTGGRIAMPIPGTNSNGGDSGMAPQFAPCVIRIRQHFEGRLFSKRANWRRGRQCPLRRESPTIRRAT
jgi:hypothetical protein